MKTKAKMNRDDSKGDNSHDSDSTSDDSDGDEGNDRDGDNAANSDSTPAKMMAIEMSRNSSALPQ